MNEIAIGASIIAGLVFWPALLFWGVIGLIFIAICFEQGWLALAALAFGLIFAYLFKFLSADFVVQHQQMFYWLAAFYVPIGVVWGTVKWLLYLHSVRAQVVQYIEKINKSASADILRGYNLKDVQTQAMGDFRRMFGSIPPKISEHKSDMVRWMTWWPFSMIASIFDDFIRQVFTSIYNFCGRMWQQMSNWIFREIDYEFKNIVPKDEKEEK